MKNFFYCIFLFAFFGMLIITSCKTNKNPKVSPAQVMELVKQSIEKGNTEEMLQNFCDQDAKKIRNLNAFGQLVLGTRGKALGYILKNKLMESHQLQFDGIEFKNEVIHENDASIDAINSQNTKLKTFHFTKVENTWKICK